MIALVCTLFASCMGDSYADPEVDSPNVGSPYGNNDIKDENVIIYLKLSSYHVYQTEFYKVFERLRRSKQWI